MRPAEELKAKVVRSAVGFQSGPVGIDVFGVSGGRRTVSVWLLSGLFNCRESLLSMAHNLEPWRSNRERLLP